TKLLAFDGVPRMAINLVVSRLVAVFLTSLHRIIYLLIVLLKS
ncbi:MAG: hypothetical protein H6Q63_1063, partial [Firmicutes bacterium]|nr:hypothetical protein [Bacillota bacterium]